MDSLYTHSTRLETVKLVDWLWMKCAKLTDNLHSQAHTKTQLALRHAHRARRENMDLAQRPL